MHYWPRAAMRLYLALQRMLQPPHHKNLSTYSTGRTQYHNLLKVRMT